MCGISGIMYFNKKLFVKKKQIHNMNLTLKHRGLIHLVYGFLKIKILV